MAIGKICTGCGKRKGFDEFSQSKGHYLGYKARCKRCVADYALEYLKRKRESERTGIPMQDRRFRRNSDEER
jgi:hypothetical protein